VALLLEDVCEGEGSGEERRNDGERDGEMKKRREGGR